MKYVIIVLGLIVGLFILLGLKSQKGTANGLVEGHLAPPSSAPNTVSSEVDVQPEKKVAPLNASLEQINSPERKRKLAGRLISKRNKRSV